MRSDLHHLPERQQRELERVRDTLLAGFEAAKNGGGGGTQAWRCGGKVLKIILFGSYARGDWVDEPQNGYLSDFDLLIHGQQCQDDQHRRLLPELHHSFQRLGHHNPGQGVGSER